MIQQLSCYGVLADSHLTSPRSTQSPGPPPLPCTTRVGPGHGVVTNIPATRDLEAASGSTPVHPVGGRSGSSVTRQQSIDIDRRFYVTPAPMALLSGGVPLSLLLDLVLGPNSEDLLSHEHLSDIRDSYE